MLSVSNMLSLLSGTVVWRARVTTLGRRDSDVSADGQVTAPALCGRQAGCVLGSDSVTVDSSQLSQEVKLIVVYT